MSTDRPYFLVRVELHQATEQDYSDLHVYMSNRGFNRNVSITGKVYKLPTAEYIKFSSDTVSVIRDQAVEAAAATNKTFTIVAVKSADWAHHGLIPV